MFRIIWVISIHLRNFMRRYMPTNILLDAIRTRRGLKWGVPAMLLAIPYLVAASTCTALIDGGASRWLYVVALVCIWNALKFIVIGPVSVVVLLKGRNAEGRAWPRQQPRSPRSSKKLYEQNKQLLPET
ncbi:sulfate permease [Salinibacterium sp. G-O1]|uniref:sulfate permease n=1 Tax=Salinibacterium sp. G-O1 TaxID=3046208 RepID=UPI0024B88800|nr:sulfate permease [Salinibacterium sp. G-O1]MDJ0334906.1 sulfate permease [Salinibacterium sp. G-O1]